MSLTTGNVIKHSVEYLNHDADIMYIAINHWEKSAFCNIEVTEPNKITNLSYFTVYLVISFKDE